MADIDYGSHSAATAPIDYGTHSDEEGRHQGSFATFATAALSRLNPVEAIRGIGKTLESLADHPVDTILSSGPIGVLKKAKESYESGNYGEAALHLSNAIIPAGFAEDEAMTKIARGKVAEGLGDMTGDVAGAYLGTRIPAVVSKIPDIVPALAKGVAAAIPEIPVFPKKIGDYAAPLKALGKGFAEARDAAAAREVGDLPEAAGSDSRLFPWEPTSPESRGQGGVSTPPSSTPPPSPGAVPPKPKVVTIRSIDELLGELRKKLEQRGALTPGQHLGELPKGSYPDRWDEGAPSPTVQSTTSRTNILKPGETQMVSPKAINLAQQLVNELAKKSKKAK